MAYAGFDRADCPDLAMMARLKAETNLEFCGFYLPAPSQRGTTWRGKRAALVAQGWGIAAIFVGQQVTGPGARNVTAEQGSIDGARADAAMAVEGFAPGSWVYLDLENGPPLTQAQVEYVRAWSSAVERGFYRAGVYCSYMFAAQVQSLLPSARLWVFHVPSVAAHPVDGTTFPTPDPKTSGFAGAVIWQRADEARLTAFDNLACDLNSAMMRDPGAPADLHAPAPRPPAPIPAPPDIPPPLPLPSHSTGVLWPWLVLVAIVGLAIGVLVWEHFR